MLVDKELKKQKQQVDKIEAEWSKAQKDLVRAKVAVSNAEADILAREQSKNKLLAQCIENGRKFKYSCRPLEQTRLQQKSRSRENFLMFVWFTLPFIVKKTRF